MSPPTHPFDNTQADLILRSKDGVDFRVFKNILSLSSDPLAKMANKPDENQIGVRRLDFDQDSKGLDFILRHLYPVSRPATVTLADVGLLAEFADCFKVDVLKPMVVHYLKDTLEGDPIGVYAIALKFGYLEVAAKAAQLSLQLHISALQSSQLETSAVGPYRELIKYHAACGAAASDVAFKREWFPLWEQWGRLIWTSNSDGSSNIRCLSCAAPDFVNMPPVHIFWPQTHDRDTKQSVEPLNRTRFAPWRVWDYLQRSSKVLAHHPTKVITEEDFVIQSDCSECILGTREDILEFSRIFAMAVEEAIKKVPLPDCVEGNNN